MTFYRRAAAVLVTLSVFVAPTLAQQLTDGQRSAIKSACRGDYMSVCASVPTGTKASLDCLVQHASSVSGGCRTALAPAMPPNAATPASTPTSSALATTPAAAATTAAPTTPAASAGPPSGPGAATRQLSPREEARVLRSDCGGDYQKFCASTPLGGGRGATCLRTHATELTPACRAALPSAR
jgi:hypothetical protein